jgi:hypothetical protein
MGTLYEIGIKFGLQGTEGVDRLFNRMGTGLRGLSRQIGSDVPQAERNLERVARATEKMSQRVSRAFGVAKVAAAGLVTGKAFSVLGGWVAGNPEMDRAKDFLRQYDASPEALRQYRDHLKELRRRIPGVAGGDYLTSIYDMQSTFAPDKPELNKRGLESALYMAKALGPSMSLSGASNLMRTFTGSYGLGKSEEEQLTMMEKFSAQMQTVLSQTKARGHDIEIGMGHIAALYSQMGQSPAAMLSDLGIVGGVLHERSGDLLKNVFAKQGEGYGKLLAGIGKARVLQRWGVGSEADLDDERRKDLHEQEKGEQERYAAHASRMIARDPEEYWRYLNKALTELNRLKNAGAIDAVKALSDAFGETAVQGLPLLAKAHASGEYQKLLKTTEEADPLKSRKKIDESFQSWTAKYDILMQRAEDASRAVKASFQGVIADQFEGYGQFFDRIANLWDQRADQIIQNLRPFAAGFKSGLAEAFGGLPDVTGWMTRIVDLLEGGNPEKWKEIGQSFGQIAGTNLSSLTTSLGKMAEALPPIAQLMGQIATAVQTIDRWGTAVAGVREKYAPTWLGGTTYMGSGEREKSLVLTDKAASPYESLGDTFTPEPKMRTRAMPPSLLDQQAGQMYQQYLDNKTDVTVNNSIQLDGDDIAAKVTPRVEKNIQENRDRSLRGAGSTFR